MPNYVVPSGRVLTTGDFLEVAVRLVMTPGVIAISEKASLGQAYDALVARRIHALLVVDDGGEPLGWATAAGMLGFAESDRALVAIRDAITEEPHRIGMQRTVGDAIARFAEVDTTHLIVVEEEGSGFPLGTVSELDLAAFLGRHA